VSRQRLVYRPSDCLGGADRFLHSLTGRLGDQGTHVGAGPVAGADVDLAGLAFEDVDESVGRVADGDGHRDGHAALAGGAVGAGGDVVGGELQVGVRQDDRVVLGAAEGLDALAV
jgi:hypothetical protein